MTCTPVPRASSWSACVKLLTNALVAPYVALNGSGWYAASDDMLTIAPLLSLHHGLERSVGQPHEREHVQADRAFLVDDVEIGERAERAHARVVDEKVDRLDDVTQARLDRGETWFLEEVGGERRRVHAVGGTELGGDRLEPGAVAGDEHDVVATSGERVDERAPDTGGRPGNERGGHAERFSAPATTSTSAATASPICTSRITRSGSFSPCPVTVHTTTSSGTSRPSVAPWSSPAIDAAEAGSTKQPSSEARKR